MSARYAIRLRTIYDEFAMQNVEFKSIFSESETTLEQCKQKQKDFNFPFELEFDSDGTMARQYGVTVSPTVVVLDANNSVVYFGAIDDHRDPNLAKRNFLREALVAVGQRRRPLVTSFPSSGCSIFFPQTRSTDRSITYFKHIRPQLQKNCVSCHNPQGAAPFSLSTYAMARKWATMAVQSIENSTMPPLSLHNSGEQISTTELRKWIDAGMPEGEAQKETDIFAPKTWTFGTPSFVWTPPVIRISQQTGDVIENFVVRVPVTERLSISAFQVLCKPKSPIRGVSIYTVKNPPVEGGESFYSTGGPNTEVDQWLGNWSPGTPGFRLPAGVGVILEPETKLLIQVRYRSNGFEYDAFPRIGLFRSSTSFSQPNRVQRVIWDEFSLSQLDMATDVRQTYSFDRPTTLTLIEPIMRYFGKSVRASMTFPDGRKMELFERNNWSFAWQSAFLFRKPLAIPAGSKLHVHAMFDASLRNFENPQKESLIVQAGPNLKDPILKILIGSASLDW